MSILGIATINGESGEDYDFVVYPWGTEFEQVSAVYLVAKKVVTPKGDLHVLPIYIGQADDLTKHFDTHNKLECFAKHGADCICVLVVNDDKHRSKVEFDVMAKHKTVCNH